MKNNSKLIVFGVIVLVGLIALTVYNIGKESQDTTKRELSLAISPYQDLAMIVNAKPLGLEEKYNTTLDLKTMAWQDIVPSVIGGGVDVGFAGYNEYLTMRENINDKTNDPLVFFYPAYVFKGGAFVTFKSETEVPTITKDNVNDCKVVNKFLSSKIGLMKNSVYEMMIYHMAKQCNFDINKIQMIDVPLEQAFLASQTKSLDIGSAGLTQIAETNKRGGRIVLDMETLGFSDLTGFIARKSTLENKKVEINNMMKMWFESVDYVQSDLDNNSTNSRAYLDKYSSTKFTLDGYKIALSNEYFPRSVEESQKELIDAGGKFNYIYIGNIIQNYLLANSKIKNITPLPTPITIN